MGLAFCRYSRIIFLWSNFSAQRVLYRCFISLWVTKGRLSFQCRIIPFVGSVLTRNKVTFSVGRSQRNKDCADIGIAKASTSKKSNRYLLTLTD